MNPEFTPYFNQIRMEKPLTGPSQRYMMLVVKGVQIKYEVVVSRDEFPLERHAITQERSKVSFQTTCSEDAETLTTVLAENEGRLPILTLKGYNGDRFVIPAGLYSRDGKNPDFVTFTKVG